MRVQTILNLETCDAARASQAMEAYALVGGHDLPEEERAPFRRVRGNAFTPEDAEAILAAVAAQVARPVPEAFAEPGLQATFEGGVRANRQIALRLARSFAAGVREDLAEAGAG